MRKVLLVDGPLQGAQYTVMGDTPTLRVIPPVDDAEFANYLLSPWAPEVTFRDVTYHISRAALFGQLLWIGSVKTKPDIEDLIEVLLSDEAKEVLA